MKLRPLDAGDLELVCALERGLAWSRAQLEEELRLGLGLGAFEAGALLGYAFFRAQAHEWWLMHLRVDERARRRGIGRALVERGSALAPAGCEEIWLEVAADNDAARALYRALGFAERGRRAKYYEEADAVLMAARAPL